MATFRIIGKAVSFNSGVIHLSTEQAADRAHNLEDLGNGAYQILQPIQFKEGEEVGYDGEINPAQLLSLEPLLESLADPDPEDPHGVLAMTKPQLVAFARDQFLEELDAKAPKPVLVEAVLSLLREVPPPASEPET